MPSDADILVYDIGTTSVKSAVFDSGGIMRLSVSEPYSTDYPKPGWAEQDPDQFWEAAVRGTRKMSAQAESSLGRSLRIEAVGMAGRMNGCLAVDSEGIPVYPELIHSDSRGGSQCGRIIDILGEEFLYAETANRTNEHLSLSKILWLKDEAPESFKRAAWFINAKDYLRFKLTGILGLTDYSDASLTGAFNLKKKSWSAEILDGLGLSRSCFPELKNSTEIGGVLSADAASALGLARGIPVSVGGGDAACASRGSGIGAEAESYISIGSSAWASMLAPSPVYDEKRRIQNFFDLDGRSCNICVTLQCAGAALDWAMDLLAGNAAKSSEGFRRIEAELEAVLPGSEGVMFLPYLMGERTPHWDSDARGAFIGLSLTGNPRTLLRAVYEGISFGLKDITEVYDDLSMPAKSFILLGGGIRSEFWRRMICDIIGKPMLIHPIPNNGISLGAAMAAGVSVGIWKNLEAAAEAVNFTFEKIVPDADASRYIPYFNIYRGIYGQLKPVFKQLAMVKDV
ncbi:MAG: hypothetical protein LBQ88_22415 [Treponema sp.]|jgi:xylulokinase|nr:hypothetical protein [Treponema sp.]